ncbi:thiamine diphosphate-binding protein [Xylariaceae sp. FL0594]|nr:thiamine diphosphate-binding protein [Xylariaceae sp. FL0594]
MPDTITLADYLFTRLKQLGIGSVHGVPGDFNLELLDYVEPAGLQWVGNANELNAGYAADGYARIKGVGALITTFGVGELSAINAIAGAYAERAAVVHIVGTPSRATQDARTLVHHTFNDGEFGRFAKMAVPMTVAQVDLKDPRTSPGRIDFALTECLLHSRPVYIQVPVDMVSVPVSAERLSSEIQIPEPISAKNSEEVIAEVIDLIYSKKQPVILVDGETRAFGITDLVQKLVEVTGWPTWSTAFGWGLLDETLPNVHGIYRGRFDDGSVKSFVDESDLILCFGPHFSTTNSYALTSIPKPESTIFISGTEVKMGNQIFRDIPAKFLVSKLLEKLESRGGLSTYPAPPDVARPTPKTYSETLKDKALTQATLWPIVNSIVQPGDIILGETGSAGHGARDMTLPKHVRTFLPVTWLSIGYMLGAAQGAALAQRELIASSKYHGIQSARTILFIGDGSFQMTVQELGTIIRHNLNVTVFLINNDGYTIERVIHGLRQGYNDVATWRYTQAPSFFGAAEDTFTATVRTCGELQAVLETEALRKVEGVKFVEVILDREDVPAGPLQALLDLQLAKQK